MGLGDLVNNIAEKETGTNLNQFLNKFGSSAGKYVDTINPLATFDIQMKFNPTIKIIQKKPSLGDKLLNAAGTAITNLGNNLTGGLLGSLLSDDKTVINQRNDFRTSGEKTFMEYLAKANLLVGSENWFNSKQTISPLILQLGFYVQGITLPRIKMIDGGKVSTQLADFITNGSYLTPDNNNIQMDILCTKLPLIERIFYPWMREVTFPYWSYDEQPYTTADITIDFNKHTDLKYLFTGCRPTSIDVIQPKQSADAEITRQVTFTFDFMFIISNLTTQPSVKDRLLGAASSVLNSAGNMVGF